MVNVSLIELKNHKNTKDITLDLIEGTVKLKTKYTILFLYNVNTGGNAYKFIKENGGWLHNKTSGNISIITYFTNEMSDNWRNVYNRDMITIVDETNSIEINTRMRELQEAFDVNALPAIIILKKEKDKDRHCIIELDCDLEPSVIKDKFEYIIDTIDQNCEQRFEIICYEVRQLATKIGNNGLKKFNTFDDIALWVKNYNRTQYNYTQEDLADELGISIRTLRNKRNNNSFTRDECIYIALRLKRSIDDLNNLLRANERPILEHYGKDEIIRTSLIEKAGIDKTKRALINRGYYL